MSQGFHYVGNCPCVAAPFSGVAAPPFVGENYFCESGISGEFANGVWYLDDPLWDSQGCTANSTHNNIHQYTHTHIYAHAYTHRHTHRLGSTSQTNYILIP